MDQARTGLVFDMKKAGPPRSPDSGIDLTEREIQVVSLIAQGRTEREIAEQLSISQSTVHFHAEQSRRKLGARNRAHLAALAVARGIVNI